MGNAFVNPFISIYKHIYMGLHGGRYDRRKLNIAFWNYDRTRLLADGTVKINGVDATFHSGRIVPEIFEAMIRRRAYDVSELGMTYLLRTMEVEEPPFSRLPGSLLPPRSDLHQ